MICLAPELCDLHPAVGTAKGRSDGDHDHVDQRMSPFLNVTQVLRHSKVPF
jgi:hypothetical protein